MVKEENEKIIENDVPVGHYRVQKEYLPEYADIAAQLVAAHFTEQDLAYSFGISVKLLKRWKKEYPLFKEACEDGKRAQKKRLVARAFKQAMGYNYVERNVKRQYNKDGELIKTDESEYHKENPGNERLLVFLLCNLDRQQGDDEWRSVQQIEVKQDRTINVQIDGKSAKEQIRKLAGDIIENERKQIESTVVG